MSKSVIEVKNVTKVFATGTVALKNVSLEVPKGQMMALIGLSGSGKSTLLRHLNGLAAPTEGEINVLGVPVNHAKKKELRELRRQVGFIFQQFGLVGRLTAIENVLSGALGSLRGPRFGVGSYNLALRKQALENLERVGLADYAFQRADTLSGGQMQRVAIARTLMQKPSLMLADEPVASLDPESSAQVMDIMLKIAKEEKLTVVVTLHQVELAMGWADRIVGLRDGEVVLDDEPKKLGTKKVMEVYQRVAPEGTNAQELAKESLFKMGKLG
ncbi:phosphonate ABC transporter ATP-binding protein [Aquiluna borgnonia]|uniref:Phosphonate ABC transporter ATP-binding protein n=1 Tax=Aquiluna borgnonia TaxID=2499157 RepID=A0A7D4PQM0_9MICO|nr:phosphonate ABC transporter ATP-binding protein [Aquiluna borgnonia]QKJ25121.1 phosphonate ABC transporter ATP-binding protein [Aquiluna borgnonia]